MTDNDRDARQDRRQDRHEERHDLDDQYDLKQERRRDRKDRADVVTRADVDGLIESVEGLEAAIEGLSHRMERQWNAQHAKRRRLAWWLAVYTLVVAYAVGAMVDEHIRNCMTFGSVQSERTKMVCDITVPFHDHHRGGISDEDFEDAIERARQIWDGRE